MCSALPVNWFRDFRERQTVFDDLGAVDWSSFNLAGDEAPPERIQGAVVSANALELVGVAPMLGRVFVAGDDGPDATPTIVLSHSLWQNRYGADPAIVGRTILVDGAVTEVVGVMPEGFAFPFEQVAWMPYRYDPATMPRRAGGLEVFGRRLEGIDVERVDAELAQISRDLEQIHPDDNEGVRAWAAPFTELYMPREITGVMFLMLAATLGVLLIAYSSLARWGWFCSSPVQMWPTSSWPERRRAPARSRSGRPSARAACRSCDN